MCQVQKTTYWSQLYALMAYAKEILVLTRSCHGLVLSNCCMAVTYAMGYITYKTLLF